MSLATAGLGASFDIPDDGGGVLARVALNLSSATLSGLDGLGAADLFRVAGARSVGTDLSISGARLSGVLALTVSPAAAELRGAVLREAFAVDVRNIPSNVPSNAPSNVPSGIPSGAPRPRLAARAAPRGDRRYAGLVVAHRVLRDPLAARVRPPVPRRPM